MSIMGITDVNKKKLFVFAFCTFFFIVMVKLVFVFNLSRAELSIWYMVNIVLSYIVFLYSFFTKKKASPFFIYCVSPISIGIFGFLCAFFYEWHGVEITIILGWFLNVYTYIFMLISILIVYVLHIPIYVTRKILCYAL